MSDDIEQLKIDAARWRALIGSARIRPIGSAGLYKDTMDKTKGYAHLGLELWTLSEKSANEHVQRTVEKEHATGVLWLTAYVDIARGLPRLPPSKR